MAFQDKKIIEGVYLAAVNRAFLRFVIVAVLFLMAFTAIGVRLVYLTVGGEKDISSHVIYAKKEHPRRADIIDRNGALLATSLKTASLYVDQTLVNDPVQLASKLQEVLPQMPFEKLVEKLEGKKRFVWVYRNLSPNQQYEVNAIGDPALAFRNEYKRMYPQGNMFSHIIGYTNIDGRGIAGMELAYDETLVTGDKELSLTIDYRLQHILRKELGAAIDEFSAKGGSGIIMDIKTGEVLSMVSLPDFDPYYPANARPEALFNNSTLGVFEMGSTFKLFSVALALETAGIRLKDSFDTTDPIKRGRFRIRDFHPEKRPLSIPEIFMYSSNIGSARLAMEIGNERMQNFFADLGFFSPVEFELPEIGRPLIPNPWREINTLTSSYGHGIAVTPLHLIRAGAAIINSGALPWPYLVTKENEEKTRKLLERAEIQVISPATSKKMRQMMELTILEGTAKKAYVKGYRIGGKTGTAEKVTAKGYSRKKLLSSFIAAFPMDDPAYIILVIVDEPKGTKKSFGYATGGWVAAPVVAKVVKQMAPLVGLAPRDDTKAKESLLTAMKPYLDKDRKVASH